MKLGQIVRYHSSVTAEAAIVTDVREAPFLSLYVFPHSRPPFAKDGVLFVADGEARPAGPWCGPLQAEPVATVEERE